MAKQFRPVQRDQVFLLPPSMRDWLPAGHPVWLVIRAVEVMDTAAFGALRSLGGAGAPAYDPDMLVTVLVWAYANGVRSSRRIEQLCQADVAFRVICGGNLPDHTTIARFRAGFGGAVTALFAEVLGLCAGLGMGKLGVVALDGTKIAASASKSANRAEERLRELAEEAVAAHAAADAAEDEIYGEASRGDEVPEGAWSPRSRDERIAAALRSLRAEREAAEAEKDAQASAYLARVRAGWPGSGSRPAAADVTAARIRLEQATAAQQARIGEWERRDAANRAGGGGGLRNPPRRPASCHVRVREAAAALERAEARQAAAARKAARRAREVPGPVRNVTDPDSRLMPVRGGGFIQGYNAQNVVSQDGLIIATALTGDPVDCPWFEPMLARARDAAAVIAAHRPAASAGREPDGQDHDGDPGGGIGLALADAGYCSEANLTCPGPDRLIAVGKGRDLEKAARDPGSGGPDWGGPAIQAMRGRLKTPEGIAAYRQRGHIAETPHGNIKHNMGMRQLSVRGKRKTAAEWTFTAAVHNLLKAISAGYLTSQDLTALAQQAT